MQIYTDAAQAALRQAKRISGQMKHPYTGTEHILLGLLREQESTAGRISPMQRRRSIMTLTQPQQRKVEGPTF